MKLTELRGVGPKRAEILRAMGIDSLRDLLYTLPVRYEDHDTVYPLNTSCTDSVLVGGVLSTEPKSSWFHGLSRVSCTLREAGETLSLCWFNEPWVRQSLHAGQTIRLYGRISVRGGRRTLQNPKIVTDSGLIPVYRMKKGFPASSFRDLMRQALEYAGETCPETLPEEILSEYHLMPLTISLLQAHFPESRGSLLEARRRLAFERMLVYLAYVSMAGRSRKKGFAFDVSSENCDTYWQSLSFPPTEAQKRVLLEIAQDLTKDEAMSRLVQGDVGCGKTAIAFGAIFLTVSAGFQACMMAPTEILARQHFESAQKMLAPLGVRCGLLTGSTKAAQRREILKRLASGECQAVFGTHALISQGVNYAHLGLSITDEQHRFGVNQRTSLQMKGEKEERVPHTLVMSATPIPRTMALILYGDLDLSVVDEMPAGRIPVKTRLVPEGRREDLYQFLRRQVSKGAQAYIVCPLVEDSESLEDVRSAKSVFEQLRQDELKGLRLGLTWGTQKSEDKAGVLNAFMNGEIDVLVSTTVIEVGVNNPRATIMIVENAERYGLSQLHQLRGRVGRGNLESWCFLLSGATERLKILCETNDGFLVSRKDLELRGPGDLIGTRQSGTPMETSLLDGDLQLLEEATACVQELHRNPAKAQALDKVESTARSFFAGRSLQIGLN